MSSYTRALRARFGDTRALRGSNLVLGLASLAALLLTIGLGLRASQWVGQPFPGFLVLPNLIVASVGRTEWPAVRSGALYQSEVTSLDDVPVQTSGDVYRAVADRAVGTTFAYEASRGITSQALELRSIEFTRADFWSIFGAYLTTGLIYLIAGLLGAALSPEGRLARALLLVGGLGGVYALSGATVYAPDGNLTLHALAEALFPASLVQLTVALSRRDTASTRALVPIAWWLSVTLAIPYLLLLHQPAAYSAFHAACETYMGAAGAALVVTLLVERMRREGLQSPLQEGALVGAFLGLGVPATIMILSGLSGGALPVNVVTTTAFLFPLGLAWGVIRERDALRRGLSAVLSHGTGPC